MAAVQKWLPVLADVATVVVGVIVIGMLGSRYLSPPGEFPTPDTYIGVNLNDALGIDIKQAGRLWCPRTKKRIRDMPGYTGI